MNIYRNILCIEDDEIDVLHIKRITKGSRDLIFTYTDSFHEAIQLLHKGNFDLIIADNKLADGHLSDFAGQFGDIPFIIISGLDEESLNPLATKLGASGFLPKPVNRKSFFNKLGKVLAATTTETTVTFDMSAIDNITGGDEALAMEMLQLFISKFPKDMEMLKGLFSKQRTTEAQDLAHKMKSSFNLFKEQELGQVCQRLENWKEVTQPAALLNKLEKEGTAFIKSLSISLQKVPKNQS